VSGLLPRLHPLEQRNLDLDLVLDILMRGLSKGFAQMVLGMKTTQKQEELGH
jgi:hypothetical protein